MNEEAGEDRYKAVVAYLKIYIKKTITTCLPEVHTPGTKELRLGNQFACISLYGNSSPVKLLRCEIFKCVTKSFKILSQSSWNVKHDLVPLLIRMVKMGVAVSSLPHTSSRCGI